MAKHIMIRGHKYTVKHVDKFDDGSTIGRCSQRKAAIEILKGMPKSIDAETTIHEVLHAVCYHSGVYRDKRGMVGEEHMIDAISNGLYQLGFKPPIK